MCRLFLHAENREENEKTNLLDKTDLSRIIIQETMLPYSTTEKEEVEILKKYLRDE